jgi:hypothetical protein
MYPLSTTGPTRLRMLANPSGCGVKRSMLGFCLKQKSKMRSET